MKKNLLLLVLPLFALLWSCSDDESYPSLVSELPEISFFEPSDVKVVSEGTTGTTGLVVAVSTTQVQPLYVNFTIEEISAIEGDHFTMITSNSQAIIPANEASGFILFDVIDDAVNAGFDKEFRITLESITDTSVAITPDGGAKLNSIIVRIADNDCPPGDRDVWFGNVSVEDVGFNTYNGTAQEGVIGCDFLSVTGNLVGSGLYAGLSVEFELTPDAPGSTTGTAVATPQQITSSGTYEATGTYDTSTMEILVDYEYISGTSGNTFWTGSNVIKPN